MTRFSRILIAALAALAWSGPCLHACMIRPERDALYAIARGLQEHVFSSFKSEPGNVRLDQFMRAEQLTGEQVHCSDFSLELVTATKREWTYDIVYRPHLAGQPKAVRARVTVFPFSHVNEPVVDFSGNARQAVFARSPWSSESAWDGNFRVRQRDRKIISMAALLALPIGLTSGLIFAIWLARLRRNARRKGAPSLGFMFALGSTLCVLILGVLATPAASPLHWALVAFFFPSAVVVSSGIVSLLYDRALQVMLHAFSAGQEQNEQTASAWRIGRRTSAEDVAEGYRMSWSTKRA